MTHQTLLRHISSCAFHCIAFTHKPKTMSITTLSRPDPDTIFNKTFRRRNDSDDLDVFEASRYFSGEPTVAGDEKQSTINYWNKTTGRVRRMSLDMPITRTHNHHHTAADQKQIFKDKKHKQPSSPGGRLASFLNSLFSQSKKKPKSTEHDQERDQDLEDRRRRRRSSISHFSTTHTNPNQSSSPIYFLSSKKPGPRFPPVQTGYRTVPDLKETAALSVPNKLVVDPSEVHYEKFRLRDERKENFTTSVAKINKLGNSDRNKPDFCDIDDGAESDSSSDLFELQNCDLGGYSRGLPVYETSHVNDIKNFSIEVNM